MISIANVLVFLSFFVFITSREIQLSQGVLDANSFKNKRELSNEQRREIAPGWLPGQWPLNDYKFGQVSGISLDIDNNVYVFHRGDRVWGDITFNINNRFQQHDLGPIQNATIIVFHINGTKLHERGSGMFYIPHGITVDKDKNIWVTDVALHQVMKLSPSSDAPVLTIGEPFIPGKDSVHLCKPTSVAVSPENGDFFVADGYCNSRILKFNSVGVKILEWGKPSGDPNSWETLHYYGFSIPHALTLIEKKQVICVADREDGRVACYNMFNGSFVKEFSNEKIGSRIFSVTHSPINGGLLYLVNGPFIYGTLPVQGFVLSYDSGDIISTFGSNLSNPHDISVTPDGKNIFVAEINPYKVWNFVSNSKTSITTSIPVVALYQTSKFDSTENLTGPILISISCFLFVSAIIVALFIFTRRKKSGTSDTIKLLAQTDIMQ